MGLLSCLQSIITIAKNGIDVGYLILITVGYTPIKNIK